MTIDVDVDIYVNGDVDDGVAVDVYIDVNADNYTGVNDKFDVCVYVDVICMLVLMLV